MRAGVTQLDLARRSGVSERTIRGLERNQVTSPRLSTLLALAAGLELTREHAEDFIRAASGMGRVRTYREALADAEALGLRGLVREGIVRSFLDRRVVSASRLVEVGPTRMIESEWYVTTLEALTDGVDQHMVYSQSRCPHEDMRRVRFENLVGCRLDQHDSDEQTSAAHLGLGETLRAGQIKTVGWREINGWVDQTGPPHDPDTSYLNSFLRGVTCVSMQVSFAGPRPSQIWKIDRSEVEESRQELTLDAFGTATAVWEHLSPGQYGVRWAWG